MDAITDYGCSISLVMAMASVELPVDAFILRSLSCRSQPKMLVPLCCTPERQV